MDRNERPPEQHTPTPPQLSAAARILTAAADLLDADPDDTLTATSWFETFNKAAATVTDGMRIADADDARDIAWTAVPHAPLGATRADWQQRIRQIAEGL